MSTKHPLTTDTITFGSGTISPDLTGELSDTTDPTLVQWKRRPYETHGTGYPAPVSTTGVHNRLALDYPPPSPTHPLHDLDFDAKPSSNYESMSQLPRASGTKCEDVEKLSGGGSLSEKAGSSHRRWACVRCSLYFLTFVALLSCLLACGALALTSYVYFVEQPQQEDSVSDLEIQLMEARETIAELRSMVEELRRNVSDNANLNTQVGELHTMVDTLTQSVEEIANPPASNTTNTSVELYSQCSIAQRLDTCLILQETIPAQDSNDDFPAYSSCTTVEKDLNVEGFYNIDMYCAISDPRGEENPTIATLRVDEPTNKVWCYCFVNAYETRSGIVDCSLYVTRCPITAQLEL